MALPVTLSSRQDLNSREGGGEDLLDLLQTPHLTDEQAGPQRLSDVTSFRE